MLPYLTKSMESLTSITDSPYFVYIAGAAVTISGVILFKSLKRKRPVRLTEAPPNTAVIYQFKRGPCAPSLSPFPMKLEMFCRLAKIPYKADTRGKMSSKHKIPWMSYNGQVVEDSQFCQEFFNTTLGIDLNRHLDVQQKAVARCIQVMVDEHLYWTIVFFRWINDPDFAARIANIFGFPRFMIYLMLPQIRKQLNGQGMGRHTAKEIEKIMMKDLEALSDILGNQPYLMGDAMCEVDCSAFGMLAQLVWHQEDKVLKDILKDKFPNLHDYCLRIKDAMWPDWDECLKND